MNNLAYRQIQACHLMSNPMPWVHKSSTGLTVMKLFLTSFGVKKPVIQKPFEAGSDDLTAAPILSPPTIKLYHDVGTSATTVNTALNARYGGNTRRDRRGMF